MQYTQERDTFVNRRWNISIWVGFAIVIVALVSYIPLFALFPVTRDVPWANYLLFLLGGAVLTIGVRRAFYHSERYRGKISGSILGGISVLMFAFFLVSILYFGKQIPSAQSALRTGQPAASFALVDTSGKQVTSSDLLKRYRAVLLVFYRGYW